MRDKISVIMSTKDTPKEYLDASIRSILSQTFNNIEFIIVCDGSEEDYQYINAKYDDPRIKVLLNRVNKGLPYSLNRAISNCTGNYIARMDSDDISMPDRLEKELAFIKKNKVDICGTTARYIGDKKGTKRLLFNSPADLKSQLLFRSVLIHPTVFCKRSFFEKNRYSERFLCSQDYELWSRTSEKNTFGILKRRLLLYRVHDKQASVSKKKIQQDFAKEIIRSNASKITGEYDEKIFECLWFLSGRERVTGQNYKKLSKLIDYTLKMNRVYRNYEEKSIKKVFYNRFFEEIIKEKAFVVDIGSLKKIIKLYNIIDLFYYYSNKL